MGKTSISIRNASIAMLLALLMCENLFAQQPQSLVLSAPPYYLKLNPNLVKVDLPQGTNTFHYTGQSAMHSHNAAHSADGSLLFFIVDGMIYDYNGNYIDEVTDLTGNTMTGSTECLILPVPNECNKWMLISSVVEDAITTINATVYYKIIEYANQTYNTSGNPIQLNLPPIGSLGSYNAVHLALSEIRSDNSRLLFVHFGGLVYKYLIDGSTINQSTLAYFPVQTESFLTQLRSEMELIKLSDETYKLAFPYLYNFSKYHIKVMHFDNTGDNLINEVDFAMQGSAYDTSADIPKGLEFSPNGQYLYFTHTVINNSIQYIDLSNNLVNNLSVNPTFDNLNNYKLSQIERAYGTDDALLFAGPNFISALRFPNSPSSSNWLPNYQNNNLIVPISHNFTGTNYANQSIRLLADQRDGEDYEQSLSPSPECCMANTIVEANDFAANLAFNGSTVQIWKPDNNPFGGTTLNPLAVVKVRGNLVIPAGYNITMRDMTFEFLPRVSSCSGAPFDHPSTISFGAGLQIKNGNGSLAGGRLTLNNTTLTTYKACSDGLWEGVEVWGVTGAASTSNQQGRLLLTNNAQINNAFYGVTAGKKLNNYPNNSSTAPNNGGVITSGSLLQPSNITRFVNNMIDVYFPYNSPAVNNTSRFMYSQFITNDVLSDKCYFPNMHVYLFENKGARFSTCKFINDMTTSPYSPIDSYGNTGIYGIKSSFSCAPVFQNTNMTGLGGCIFENLRYGIYVKNSPYYYPVVVTNSLFRNNWRGALLNYVYNASVNANRFDLYPYTLNNNSQNAAYGLYLDYSHGFSVENNYFTTIGLDETANCYGIIANQTNAKRLCDQSDEIYRNVFEKIRVGSQTQGNNSEAASPACPNSVQNDEGLVLKCNNYIENSIGLFDIHVTNSNSIKGNIALLQGICNGQTNAPANNLFSHSFSNNENDCKISAAYSYPTNPTQIYYADYNFGTIGTANPRRPISYTPAPNGLFPIDCNLTAQSCPSKYNRSRSAIRESISLYKSIADSLLAIIDSTSGTHDSIALSSLLLEYSYHLGQRNLEIDALKRYEFNIEVNEESLDSVLSFLTEYNFPFETEKTESAKIYLSREDYAMAMIEIDALRQTGGFESFCDFMELVINVKQNHLNDSTVFTDSAKVALLHSIANDPTSGERAAAEDYLLKLDGREYSEWIEPYDEYSNTRTSNNSNNSVNNNNTNSTPFRKKGSINNSITMLLAFQVYPNPANEILYIESDKAIHRIEICDVMGKTIYTVQGNGNQLMNIPVKDFAKGIYLLKVFDQKNSFTTKKLSINH